MSKIPELIVIIHLPNTMRRFNFRFTEKMLEESYVSFSQMIEQVYLKIL